MTRSAASFSPARRKAAFRHEARQAREALTEGDLSRAYHHLERAHILGQPWAGPHSWTHAMMLKLAWSSGDWVEVRGQIVRLAAGGLLSGIGWLPLGNTGRARVSAFASMTPPADLEPVLDRPEA